MKTTASLVALCAVASLMLLNAPRQADARPQYLAVFGEKYEKVKDQASEKKCAICHGDEGKNKKQLSDFAMALKEALKMKNVPAKDKDKIIAAFDEVAKKKEGDTTYGDLLKEGKLPAPFKAEEK